MHSSRVAVPCGCVERTRLLRTGPPLRRARERRAWSPPGQRSTEAPLPGASHRQESVRPPIKSVACSRSQACEDAATAREFSQRTGCKMINDDHPPTRLDQTRRLECRISYKSQTVGGLSLWAESSLASLLRRSPSSGAPLRQPVRANRDDGRDRISSEARSVFREAWSQLVHCTEDLAYSRSHYSVPDECAKQRLVDVHS